jgi:hypothetical protein
VRAKNILHVSKSIIVVKHFYFCITCVTSAETLPSFQFFGTVTRLSSLGGMSKFAHYLKAGFGPVLVLLS